MIARTIRDRKKRCINLLIGLLLIFLKISEKFTKKWSVSLKFKNTLFFEGGRGIFEKKSKTGPI